MVFEIRQEELAILNTVQKAATALGVPAFAVGGYVRDRLLNRPSKDLDIVCVGDGIQLAHEVAGNLWPIPRVVVYRRFGTAMLKHNDLEIEFVGARKESYRPDSRKPEVEAGTLRDDQYRRDFTINALAVCLNQNNFGMIIDPFDGLEHLERKILKTPLDPGRTFSDDPLRMMRAIRFASQLEFEIEQTTLEGIERYRNRIGIVSMERISTELNKILLSNRPSVGFKLLFETKLLDNILPELAELQGVEIRKGIGHKDNFYHTLQVVDNVAQKSNNLWLRWAALLHDIAKPATKRFHPKAGWTFHGHEALGATMVPRIFKRLRLPLDQPMKFVQKLVRLHLRPISLISEEVSDSAVRRLLFEAGDDIDALMQLCEADITSKNEQKVERYLSNYKRLRTLLEEVEANDRLRNWQPPITGEDIMETFDIKPSKVVGDIKIAIREAILDGIIPNERAAAFSFMLRKGEEFGLQAHN